MECFQVILIQHESSRQLNDWLNTTHCCTYHIAGHSRDEPFHAIQTPNNHQ